MGSSELVNYISYNSQSDGLHPESIVKDGDFNLDTFSRSWEGKVEVVSGGIADVLPEEQEGRALIDANSNSSTYCRQVINLQQQEAYPIIISGWSRSQDVDHHHSSSDYSIYVDLWLEAEPWIMRTVTVNFDPVATAHDWQWRYALYFPERPILRLHIHLILRNSSGKAWFDKIEVVPFASCMYLLVTNWSWVFSR